MENEEERGKSLSANDEVAAAAEAHGEVSAAVSFRVVEVLPVLSTRVLTP